MTEISRDIKRQPRPQSAVMESTPRHEAGLCLVRSIASGCRIYRDTVGRYVVQHGDGGTDRRAVATLAGAYAACRGWEQRVGGVLDQAAPG